MSFAALLVLAACAPESASAPTPAEPVAVRSAAASPRVMVVSNANAPGSLDLAEAYAQARGLQPSQVLSIAAPNQEQISTAEFEEQIRKPILTALDSNPSIDFVVLCKGVPLRLDSEAGDSVDSRLALFHRPRPPIDPQEPATILAARQPFFGSTERFSRAKFEMVLVTRLDGFTFAAARALIGRGVGARTGGKILLDTADNRREGGFGQVQDGLLRAEQAIKNRGGEPWLERTPEFVSGEDLGGYVSWGSNDDAFDLSRYRALRFRPGAIGETLVSTSGRTFTKDAPGQSLIGDLIDGGITGIKGYVAEPYTFALAKPELLFDRYLAGWTLAESYYAASLLIGWKDIVIGDPLAAPYEVGVGG